MQTVEIQLRSARMALERIHVLGSDADLLAGAIRAVGNAIEAIDTAKKEAEEHAADDKQGKDL